MPHIKKLNFSNPVGLYDPRANGYSHLAQFPAGWRIITPAGQGGETANTELSPDFRTQFAQAVENTRTVLAAAGATLEDIAKINSSSTMTPRKWTLIPVPTLALERMLVEIDVIAVVPAGRRLAPHRAHCPPKQSFDGSRRRTEFIHDKQR